MNPWSSLIEPPQMNRLARGCSVRKPHSRLGERGECAQKLLRLGPLSWGEFLEITGWPVATASGALGRLKTLGIVHRQDGAWRLS